jgi:hypothetical protein
MATVWAIHSGVDCTFTESQETGWTDVFGFSTLDNLISEMNRRGLQGQVEKLAIVAHGNAPGVVHLDRPLNLESIPSFYSPLHRLRWYLRRHSHVQLAFYACVAGALQAGTAFLIRLSEIIPDRTIIGFTDWGVCGAGSQASNPGLISPNATGGRGYITLGGIYAKWACKGRIVRWPHSERP